MIGNGMPSKIVGPTNRPMTGAGMSPVTTCSNTNSWVPIRGDRFGRRARGKRGYGVASVISKATTSAPTPT